MSDDVLNAFLRRNTEELAVVLAASDVVHLTPEVVSGDPPRRLHGVFTDVEHFARSTGETFLTSRRHGFPIAR